jgi:hypothetical protein
VTANYKPTPITFTQVYEGDKMIRLAQQVTDLANQLGTVNNKVSGGTVPSGGSAGEVLTWLASSNAPGWAAAQAPATFPWDQLTGVPTSFPAQAFILATPAGLGPLPQISGASPGMTLVATGAKAAQLQFLNYAQLGDVDITGLADGYVPAWSTMTGKWEMVPNGGGFSGLTPGTIYTATSPTTAQFLPLSFTGVSGTATPAQVGAGTPQYGLGDAVTPLLNPAGTAQWLALNEPPVNDSLLTGDGYWKAIRDIEISWSQISDIPGAFPIDPNATYNFISGGLRFRPMPGGLTPLQIFMPLSDAIGLSIAGQGAAQIDLTGGIFGAVVGSTGLVLGQAANGTAILNQRANASINIEMAGVTVMSINTGGVVTITPITGQALSLNGISGASNLVINIPTGSTASGINMAAPLGAPANITLRGNGLAAGSGFLIGQNASGVAVLNQQNTAGNLVIQRGGVVAWTFGAADFGLFNTGASGGDQGAGTINVSGGFYINGVPVSGGGGGAAPSWNRPFAVMGA